MPRQAVPGKTIIFVNTKRSADTLEADLYDLGCPAASVHGDKDQRERERALDAFKMVHASARMFPVSFVLVLAPPPHSTRPNAVARPLHRRPSRSTPGPYLCHHWY